MQTSQKKCEIEQFYYHKHLSMQVIYFPKALFIINSFMTEVLLYRNQSICLQSKSMDWFLHDKVLRHERVNGLCNRSKEKGCQFLLLSVSNKMVARRVSTSWVFRGSRSQMFFRTNQGCSVRKSVLKNFANFTGKHLCWCPVLSKVVGLQAFRPATILKRDSNRGVFKWNCYFLWNDSEQIFLQNTSDDCFWV